MCGVSDYIPVKIIEKKCDELSLVRSGIVMRGCLLVMKVTKVIKKSCIFLSGHESHEKVMNFWQNY